MPWQELLTRIKIEKLLKECHRPSANQYSPRPRRKVRGDLWPGWMSKLFKIYFRWWLWKDQIDEVQGQTDALLKENQALDKKLSDRRRELHVLLQAMFKPRTIIIYSNMNRQRRTRSRIIGFGLGCRRWNWKFREKHFWNPNPEFLLHSSYSFWP